MKFLTTHIIVKSHILKFFIVRQLFNALIVFELKKLPKQTF